MSISPPEFPLYLRLTGGGSIYGKTFGLLFLLMIYFYLLGIVTMVGFEVNSLLYPVPVDQPQGKESLGTPTQAPEPEPAPPAPPKARPHPQQGHVRRSRIKGVLAFAVLWLTGPLRRKSRVS